MHKQKMVGYISYLQWLYLQIELQIELLNSTANWHHVPGVLPDSGKCKLDSLGSSCRRETFHLD
jgi:hypothetical protein